MEAKTITVNIKRKLMKLHKNRRRLRAVNMLREEVARLTKTDIEMVKIGEDVNRFFTRSARSASPKLKALTVALDRTEGKLRVSLPTAGAVTVLTKPKEEKKEAAAAVKEEAKPAAKAKEEKPKPEKKPIVQRKEKKEEAAKPQTQT
jgi:ribosomal protein L31E